MANQQTLEIGKTCAYCLANDFLPIRCPHCHLDFCEKHVRTHPSCRRLFENEKQTVQCPKCQQDLFVPQGQDPNVVVSAHLDRDCRSETINKYVCDFCHRRDMVETVCPQCRRHFCLAHRHPTSHNCAAATAAPTRSRPAPAARPAQPAVDFSNPQQVRAFQMKRRLDMIATAKGDASVPQNSRVYAEFVLPDHRHVFAFFHGDWAVGRVLDAVCDRFGVVNRNNQANQPKLYVYSEGRRLEFSAPARSLPNFGTVFLCIE